MTTCVPMKPQTDRDSYDGADWTEMDIEDLKSALAFGRSIEDAAEFLCRAGSVEDVARRAEELGLKPQGRLMLVYCAKNCETIVEAEVIDLGVGAGRVRLSPMSELGRCCRKSLLALLNTDSPSRRRGDPINVWGEAS
jgi:hypothetical protein